MKQVIGIDVGKYELMICQENRTVSLANDVKAIDTWIEGLPADVLVVFEPTGGYERVLKEQLEAHDIHYRLAHANRVREYAKACGRLAKTDGIDAGMIKAYAEAMGLEASATRCLHSELQAWLLRCEQLVNSRRQEKNRLDTVNPLNQASTVRHIDWLTQEIHMIESHMKAYICQDADLASRVTRYQTVPGIGWLSAIYLVTELPELQTHTMPKLAALVGVAPMNRDSGKQIKQRHIIAGRGRVRAVLYLATLSAIRCNSVIKPFYQRLKQKGKPGKVALIAATRKLLAIMCSIAQRQYGWEQEFVLNRA